MTAELFVTLLRKMMRHRAKPVHLVVDGLPAHKTKLVKDYVQSTKGRLTLHFLPGYAPELNPDELGLEPCEAHRRGPNAAARGRTTAGQDRGAVGRIKNTPRLVRSFFQAPSVAYITDR